MVKPSYLKLALEEVQKRAKIAKDRLASCLLCPWECHVNRTKGELGHCKTPANAVLSSFNAHFGEEPELVGVFGSGTIFFTHCNLNCVFCQNWEISQEGRGSKVAPERLASIMIQLQNKKCHNINLVTPTPHIAAILAALPAAIEQGLQIPLVYNSGGYESVESLQLLEGIVDIYMPDFKYWEIKTAQRYSGPPDYPEKACQAVKEMQRQVGDLKKDQNGIAYRGLLVRHLVLPQNLSGTEGVIRFLKEEVSPACTVNIMRQYYPAYQARQHPPLNRALASREYREARKIAVEAGLKIVR